MKQITVVSGKGGTGKTVLTACFAVLARSKVLVDCDVDAADLHLLLHPQIRERRDFSGGSVAVRNPERCNGCGKCREVCRFGAVTGSFDIDVVGCEGCGFCVRACPAGALAVTPRNNGEWFVSDTRYGPMVHARLGIAEENSGKLVSMIRRRARELALESGADYVIADGPPGIGCPVIAAITGADLVLGVAEPSLAGIHDIKRVTEIADRFRIPMCCVINKHDISPGNCVELETWCRGRGVRVVGRIPFDPAVTSAMVAGRAVVECGRTAASDAVRNVWHEVELLSEETG